MVKSFFQLILLLGVSSVIHSQASECEAQALYIPFPDVTTALCKSYKVCLSKDGSPAVKLCPGGRLYNDKTKSCTWADQADCAEAGNGCLEEGQKVPDADCKKYSVCDANLEPGTPTTCPTKEIFSVIDGDCVPEDQGYCDIDEGPDCDLDQYKTGKLLPIKNDCSAFYKCIDGIRIKSRCPGDTHLDSKAQTCVHKANSKCTDSSTLPPNVKDLCTGNVGNFVPDSLFCRGYYYCLDENTPYWSHCGDKYFLDGFCVSTKPASCTCEDLEFGTPPVKIYVQHADKSKFVICEKDKSPVPKTCPNGFIFSLKDKSCIPK